MLHAKFAYFQQKIALFNGINTDETTLFCTFWFYLIPQSVFDVFIADFYVIRLVNKPVTLVTVNVALFWEWLDRAHTKTYKQHYK